MSSSITHLDFHDQIHCVLKQKRESSENAECQLCRPAEDLVFALDDGRTSMHRNVLPNTVLQRHQAHTRSLIPSLWQPWQPPAQKS